MNIPRPHVDGRAFRGHRKSAKKALAGVSSLLLAVTLLPIALLTPAQSAQISVGQGFSITPSDLKFILAQIKIAENHVANTTSATGPCGALVGTGPNQIPSPLVSKGLRTVDGSCNNLQEGQETFGSADQVFPRIGGKDFRDAESNPPLFGPPAPSSYADKRANNVVFDSQPRVISNLIVDQTASNPAAIAAAGEPVRSQGGDPVVPCQTPPVLDTAGNPVPCVPAHETLFIPNVTTDVGLSPPYNSLFTIFGQFFDHGVDQTVKGGGTVFVPLQGRRPAGRRRRPRLRHGLQRPRHCHRGLCRQPAREPALHAADPRQEPAGRRRHPRHRRRRAGRGQHRLSVGRPEPDLHLALVAPGVPPRVQPRRWPARRDRQAARWSPRRQRRPRACRCRRGPGHLDLGGRQGPGSVSGWVCC